jgi:L-ascorbate metabolism protein UlaG (beta-lactamase superfamily)
MEACDVYVKPNLVVEPLINHWYAWSYLISPINLSLYIANHHLKIMQSFVAAPQMHVRAWEDPKLIGGPFIGLPPSRVNEIRKLMDETVKTNSGRLSMAKALRQLHDILAQKADGHSLEPLYAEVPDQLRGFVELVYDMNHAASIRLIEGLIYHGPLYDDSTQGVSMFLTEADGRPFAFSTPRLPSASAVDLQIRFEDSAIDQLHQMKREPGSYSRIKELLQVDDAQEPLFSTFFTSEPMPARRYDEAGVRVRYFGHACILIESRGLSILCDPVVSYDYEDGPARFTYADLPDRIDYVLITHNHQDHCVLECLLALRDRIGTILVPKSNPGSIADPSLKMALKRIGFTQVREIDEMEQVSVEGGAILGIPFLGEHGDLNIQSKMAFVVMLEGHTFVMAADSNNIEPRIYEYVAAAIPPVDILFIGLECEGAPLSWVYGPMLMRPLPRSMDQSRRFDGSDCRKAMTIVDILKPRQTYVYAMGMEPWLTFMIAIDADEESRPLREAEKFVALCREQGILSERLACKKEIILQMH